MATGGHQQFASYDQKLISILEILGSHFVDTFYNHVYNSAQTNLKSGGSLTDEYVRRVQSYIVGVKTDEQCYRQVVQNLHRYFQTTTRYTTLSFADFVERIVQQFIPPEYYDLLKAPEKDETLGSIVADLVSGLGAFVTSPDMIRRIIDEHDRSPRVTIRMIQDQGITILLAKRGELHNGFLRRIGQAKDTVSMDVVDDLKRAIRKLAKQKAELKVQLGETEERVLELEDDVATYKKRESQFKKLIKLMRDEREQGQPAAAFAAAMPARNNQAEPDPLDFTRRHPEIPRPEKIAEAPATPRGASFFAPSALPAATRRAAEGMAPFAAAPPEAIGGRAPDMRGGAPPARRRANIADLMAEKADDDDDTSEDDDISEAEDDE